MGTLRVHPQNPRYFMDPASGRAILLSGSHTWANFQERAYPETPPFDFEGYLDFLERHRHNFIRLWAWEHAAWMQFTERKIVYEPNPFTRTGPGLALDGGPKFDLDKLNPAYFARLRQRVEAAGRRGFYVSVMFFQGFSIEQKGPNPLGNPWHGHPFNAANNINGIDGDPDGDGQGRQVHTLDAPEITRIQEAYVRRVVETVGDFDHVLYEISNESHGESTEWQYHFIEFVRRCEADALKRHPVGMTFQYCAVRPGTNRDLFESPADWVSPNAQAEGNHDYRTDPPPADGRKVIILDTDHLWGIAGEEKVDLVRRWVWKSFLRGHNPIFMDPYMDARTGGRLDSLWHPVRRAMGFVLRLAEEVDLAAMVPRPELSSTGYCLAAPGREYLVYQPSGGTFGVTVEPGLYSVSWVRPVTGESMAAGRLRSGGGEIRAEAPFPGEAVLHLAASETLAS